MGYWNIQHGIRLQWYENDIWEAKLTLSAQDLDQKNLQYKYAVVDLNTMKMVRWEEGANRHIEMSDLKDNKPTVFKDVWG